MWDLIVSVPDHCISFYFNYFNYVVPFERYLKTYKLNGYYSKK